jgi:hypothetical protein
MRAYVALAGENEGVATALQKQEIEEQKVEQKKHRDALGFSLKWVQPLLHLVFTGYWHLVFTAPPSPWR